MPDDANAAWRVAVVTGANQGLGLALVAGLRRRLVPPDVVYLIGRDPGRVAAAAASLADRGLDVARIVARQVRREGPADVLVAAVCPGLVDTDASRPWFDNMSEAQSTEDAAAHIVRVALDPVDDAFHGELIQFGRVPPSADHDLEGLPDSRRPLRREWRGVDEVLGQEPHLQLVAAQHVARQQVIGAVDRDGCPSVICRHRQLLRGRGDFGGSDRRHRGDATMST